jgi:hypothetical protein
MSIIVVVLLLALLLGGIGAGPWWGHGGLGYGWAPSGLLGTVLVIILVLALLGRI